MTIIFLSLLFILGACFGSFLCCQARRMHARSTKKGSRFPSHSICLHCRYRLKWYDNIPIISWLLLRGRCRKCHKKIGFTEFLTEFLTAFSWLTLGLSFIFCTKSSLNHFSASPLDWAIFIATLFLTLPLIFLAIYDGLYGELPTSLLIISIVVSAIILILREISWASQSHSGAFSPDYLLQPLGAFLILGGLYFILYLASKGKWVGDGDWFLATAIALALSRVWPALLTLTLANFLAVIIMAPILHSRHRHNLPLGPFLVAAYLIISVAYPYLSL